MLRENALEKERIKLSKIVQKFNETKEQIEKLFLKLNDLKRNSDSYFQNYGFNSMMISNYNQYISKINSEILTKKNFLKNIENELLLQQEETKQAYIAVKSLENLKEKKKEQYKKEMYDEEIKILDDIVNAKRTA